MAYKTRRQKRYELLRHMGFLKFESMELSKVPLKVPYFDILIKERTKLMELALRERWSQAKYRREILREYTEKRWLIRTRTGRIATKSAWNMFRANEMVYRRRYPAYTSPWQKRRKSFRDFVTVVERTAKSHFQEWIVDLDRSIAKATGKRKEQLERQRDNLRTWVEY